MGRAVLPVHGYKLLAADSRLFVPLDNIALIRLDDDSETGRVDHQTGTAELPTCCRRMR